MKYLIKSCRAGRAGVCVNVSVTAPDSRQGTKKHPTDVETSQKHKTLI